MHLLKPLKIRFLKLLAAIALAVAPIATLITRAAYPIPDNLHPDYTPKLPDGTASVDIIVQRIYILIGAILAVSSTVAVFFIFMGGFQQITAMGNSEKLDNAKKTITWAIGGLLIVILSFALVQFITYVAEEVAKPTP